MKEEVYRTIFEVEKRHWWYRALHALIFETISRYFTRKDIRILDLGCGTGGLLDGLKERGYKCFGVDISTMALDRCRERKLPRLIQGNTERISLKRGTIDVVICIDVLYHDLVNDDLGSLKEIHEVLKPGGLLIAHLPAFELLRSQHDIDVHARHRYSKAEVMTMLAQCSFEPLKVTYRNSILFPLAAINRFITRHFNLNDDPKIQCPNDAINASFLAVTLLENALLRHVDLPFGLSVFFVARKAPIGNQGAPA